MIGNDEEVLEASWIVRVSSCLVDALFLVLAARTAQRLGSWLGGFCLFAAPFHSFARSIFKSRWSKDTPLKKTPLIFEKTRGKQSWGNRRFLPSSIHEMNAMNGRTLSYLSKTYNCTTIISQVIATIDRLNRQA